MALKRKVITVTAQATSNWIPLDNRGTSQYLVQCVISDGGAMTYDIEYTNDNVFDHNFVASTAATFDHDTLAAQTASAVGNIEYVPAAIRANVTAYTGGTLTTTITPDGRR